MLTFAFHASHYLLITSDTAHVGSLLGGVSAWQLLSSRLQSLAAAAAGAGTNTGGLDADKCSYVCEVRSSYIHDCINAWNSDDA